MCNRWPSTQIELFREGEKSCVVVAPTGANYSTYVIYDNDGVGDYVAFSEQHDLLMVSEHFNIIDIYMPNNRPDLKMLFKLRFV